MLTNYNSALPSVNSPRQTPVHGCDRTFGGGIPSDVLAAFDLETLTTTSGRPARLQPWNRPGCGPGAGGALERPLLPIENLLLHLDEAGVPNFSDELGHLFVVP